MSYDEAMRHAQSLWGDCSVVWRSYDGTHFVGRTVSIGIALDDEYVEWEPSKAIEVLGEGATWPDAFNSVLTP